MSPEELGKRIRALCQEMATADPQTDLSQLVRELLTLLDQLIETLQRKE